MKKLSKYFLISSILILSGCSQEVDIPIEGAVASSSVPSNAAFIETLVVSAYAILDGNLNNTNPWFQAASNWIYGEVAADAAYKGSDPGDQQEIAALQRWTSQTTGESFDRKWRAVFEGIRRCNVAILAVNKGLETGAITAGQGDAFLAELRFLRAHYHFEAKKIWGNVPFIDENTTASVTNMGVDAWTPIEADFQFAIDNLGETAVRFGGATSWAAKAYLAKALIYQAKFTQAKPLLDDVINFGPFSLTTNFHDNFDVTTNRNSETVFAVQYSVNDSSNGSSNGNWGDVLNFPHNSPVGGGCCGFFLPSQNLVNAFKTDANGLPLFDTFNDAPIVTSDKALPAASPFTPYQGNLDPRLDWTVGRRGIPFHDWGDFPGSPWIRDPSTGAYVDKKIVHFKSQQDAFAAGNSWTSSVSTMQTNIIRYAEVLLWRAEIAANESDLSTALEMVNRVRARSANPATFVKRSDGTDAANYVINTYPSFPDQTFAKKAVYFEQRLEMALEGHRFFELVRQGRAAQVLNDYMRVEQTRQPELAGATFQPFAERFPIPQNAIDLSQGVLQQNPGY
ncbi:MAG: RagB/SusD family nutrient uptake outer membrane protein [Bacteroidetes bacterium HGW-Bacteroidetes-13]|nr:MAG: RagB/SusD family nutrient uptake outer membrane protein [Bacteroidetes bacterium HGW-Bacteroidetes-13]